MRIDPAGVERVADRLASGAFARPGWRVAPHWWDDDHPERTATYVLVLDALNFSFWGEPRWRVQWQGQTFDGYWGLAAALRRALDAGTPVYDPVYLASRADATRLLAGLDGTSIPLLSQRQAALREIGKGILERCAGSFVRCIEQAGGDAGGIVHLVVDRFPSFRDVAAYEGREIPLYKRAQILVSDLWGACEGRGLGRIHNLDALTAFADYKVPQVLHGLGVLVYSASLTRLLLAQELLPSGDPREVEIRAATVQAVESIRDALASRGSPLRAFEVDWYLWTLGQGQPSPLPYHRTRCVAY